MTAELKPCPFCGGEPKFHKAMSRMICKSCTASVDANVSPALFTNYFALDAARKNRAVELWNSRPAFQNTSAPIVKPLEWQPMDTAPKGEVTEDAGCRGASEWFLGRVAPKYAAFRPPYIVIRRRAWPQEDSWSCAGEADYVPAFFDAWAPISAALTNTSGDDEAPVAKVVSKYGDPESFGERDLVALVDLSTLKYNTLLYARPQSAAVRDGWQAMDTAPKDGKHCILAIKTGSFVYSIQGAFMKGKWMNAADIDGEPLAWMPNIRLPDEFCPWTDEYKARPSPSLYAGGVIHDR